jgi:rhomboid family GlyGly-CTERM serine protease
MIHLPTAPQQAIGPLVLLAVLGVVYLIGVDAMGYERERIADGEVWRLMTGHFAHLNMAHLVLNASGVGVLWLLHGDYYRLDWYCLCIVVIALGTSLGLFTLSGELAWYAGLSGVLHGLFVIGVGRDMEAGHRIGWLMAIGLTMKLIWESLYGGSPQIEALIEFPVATDAHLYGSLCGAIFVGCRAWHL